MSPISNLTAVSTIPVLDLQPMQQLRNWNPSLAPWVAINPQPLPPKGNSAANWQMPGNTVSLNPQPLPPGQVFANVKAALQDTMKFHAENPQMDRSFLFAGGKNGASNPEANRMIIIVGGRIQIR
jgi:hypothetical protein